MGRSDVHFDDDILEINEHAQVIAEAAKRKVQQNGATKSPSVRDMDAEKAQDERPAAIAATEARTPRNLEVIDGKGEGDSLLADEKPRRDRPKSKSPKSSPSLSTSLSSGDDPWVTGSIKIRNSKKHRFHRLSRTRELEGLVPFQKKDLLDEALDYLFEKYSVD